MPRKARVATTCLGTRRPRSVEHAREYGLELLDLACTTDPDIVCLPENFSTFSVVAPLSEKAEPVPGPTIDACARRAREHRTYVVCPLTNRRGGCYYNSAVIIDREGDIVGIYDKVQPVTSSADFTEIEHGMTPGRESPVFQLDFGAVGVQICFDLGYPRTWAELAERGAELVFWPSAYNGGFPLRMFAYLHKYYVVSSVRQQHSRIINPLGEVLECTDRRAQVVSRRIDLDYIVCHYDFHGTIPRDLVDEYGAGVGIRTSDEESHFLVQSDSDEVALAEMIDRFGLESADDYHARHLAAYEAILEGRRPEPQQSPYEHRVQYGCTWDHGRRPQANPSQDRS